jgi:hypothetical protein
MAKSVLNYILKNGFFSRSTDGIVRLYQTGDKLDVPIPTATQELLAAMYGDALAEEIQRAQEAEDSKVDEVAGKGLTKNELTDVLKSSYDTAATQTHAAHSDDQDLSGLQPKVAGKGLTKNELTDELKSGYDDAVSKAHTHSNATALNSVSGTNTGDETASTIKTKLGIETLSGSNTGDETQISIVAKIGFTPASSTEMSNEVSARSGADTAIEGLLTAEIARASGVEALKADLVAGKVPSAQLPSYVDDVLESANYAALPATGETGKIYVTLDTNKEYRWSGIAYIEIVPSPGSTDAVAEGSTNKYFTGARAIGSILTGFVTAGTRAAIAATDSVLQALQKIQKHFDDLWAKLDTTGTVSEAIAAVTVPTAPRVFRLGSRFTTPNFNEDSNWTRLKANIMSLDPVIPAYVVRDPEASGWASLGTDTPASLAALGIYAYTQKDWLDLISKANGITKLVGNLLITPGSPVTLEFQSMKNTLGTTLTTVMQDAGEYLINFGSTVSGVPSRDESFAIMSSAETVKPFVKIGITATYIIVKLAASLTDLANDENFIDPTEDVLMIPIDISFYN